MIAPNVCRKCGSKNTTLLMLSYVCNVCEPAGGAQATPPLKYYRGWIRVDKSYSSSDSLLIGLWATVFATRASAVATLVPGDGITIREIKTHKPIVERMRVRIQVPKYIDYIDGKLWQPHEVNPLYRKDETFAIVVPLDQST